MHTLIGTKPEFHFFREFIYSFDFLLVMLNGWLCAVFFYFIFSSISSSFFFFFLSLSPSRHFLPLFILPFARHYLCSHLFQLCVLIYLFRCEWYELRVCACAFIVTINSLFSLSPGKCSISVYCIDLEQRFAYQKSVMFPSL